LTLVLERLLLPLGVDSAELVVVTEVTSAVAAASGCVARFFVVGGRTAEHLRRTRLRCTEKCKN
jgi:hypothetical protein